MLTVREIHAEPGPAASPRGRQILSRFPDADIVSIGSVICRFKTGGQRRETPPEFGAWSSTA